MVKAMRLGRPEMCIPIGLADEYPAPSSMLTLLLYLTENAQEKNILSLALLAIFVNFSLEVRKREPTLSHLLPVIKIVPSL